MRRLATAAAAAVTVVAGVAAPAGAAPAPGPHSRHVCATAPVGAAACAAIVRTDAHGTPMAAAAPSGYGPSDLRSAYNLPATGGGGRTVAIVDAYNDPTAESDLAVYRSQYGLPPCTTGNGCFAKVNQNGGSSYPATSGG